MKRNSNIGTPGPKPLRVQANQTCRFFESFYIMNGDCGLEKISSIGVLACGTLRVQVPNCKVYLPKTIITIPYLETRNAQPNALEFPTVLTEYPFYHTRILPRFRLYIYIYIPAVGTFGSRAWNFNICSSRCHLTHGEPRLISRTTVIEPAEANTTQQLTNPQRLEV